ncbi:MAG: hypothetical protein ACLS9N_08510 [[Clostridium] leptum]
MSAEKKQKSTVPYFLWANRAPEMAVWIRRR